MSTQTDTLITALQDATRYAHPVNGFKVIETHSSWVILTGTVAYKIKKPVNLGFLDFSTLEKRRADCQEEIRLNRRLAEHIYLDVIAITGTHRKPRMGGHGPAIEYAVRMQQFDPQQQFDKLLERKSLTTDHCLQLAERIAHFHDRCPIAAADSHYGQSTSIQHSVFDNFTRLSEIAMHDEERVLIEAIHDWTAKQHSQLEVLFSARHTAGFIRECHGDLHLANIALIDGEATPFDCLEFNPKLRWIDTMSEMAFLVMDLSRRGRPDLANRTLNAYLEASGDYEGITLLRYYLVYRAMVRAKVAAICRQQEETNQENATRASTLCQEIEACLKLAQGYTQPQQTRLIITHGLSGSGKSRVSEGLLAESNIIRIRSDVERRRLYPDRHLRYHHHAGMMTYQRLETLATGIIQAGTPVLIDATFLKHAQRSRFIELARRLDCPLTILDLHSPEAILRQRIRDRAAKDHDPSEADEAVLDAQIATQEPLTPAELRHGITIDTSTSIDTPTLAKRINDQRPLHEK